MLYFTRPSSRLGFYFYYELLAIGGRGNVTYSYFVFTLLYFSQLAIKQNPILAEAYSNLGNVYKVLFSFLAL